MKFIAYPSMLVCNICVEDKEIWFIDLGPVCDVLPQNKTMKAWTEGHSRHHIV